MNTTESQDLLRAYVEHRSENAFRELVERYLDLVYSVAIRRTSGDTLLAEDITQLVFTDLARKAASLPTDVLLGGWLHRHAGFVAATTLRGEQRRRQREREAAEMELANQTTDDTWNQLAPLLDELIQQLEPADRDAVVLRYLEKRDLRSIGSTLGVSEDAAQKRVSRAVEKLRELFQQRQRAAITATALATLLSAEAVKAAPAALRTRVAAKALAGAAAAGGAGLAAWWLKLFSPAAIKLLAGAAVVVSVTAVVYLNSHSAPPTAGSKPAQVQAATVTAVPAPQPAAMVMEASNPAMPELTEAISREGSDSNSLQLLIVAADSGKPIPNVQVDYRGWEGGKFTGKKLRADRFGKCVVAVPWKTITELELTARIDDFADTRLLWRTDRGQTIPASYTLKLARPVMIGGQVVDADGQPVANAMVGFNHEDDPAALKLPENHEFSWIEVPTDAEGKWTINRIAPEMIRRIYGSARHPDHVQSALVFASQDSRTEKALRAGTHVFHLGRAVTLRGTVVGSDDAPVEGAKVLVGKIGMSDRREGKTGSDGSFEIKGCRPGKTLLSAEAPGFAAQTLDVELSADLAPFRIQLRPGAVLRLRVVGPAGEAVNRANVWLDTMHNRPINAPDYGKTVVQASFNGKTGKDGRLVWSNAPAGEHEFAIAARGYMRVSEIKVPADGEEHVVKMPPALIISGTVKDANTGALIPSFRIATGWPQKDFLDGTVHGQWSSIARYWVDYTGGSFRHVMEEPVLYGQANPGYMLKFQAEGYAPFISRAIAADEGQIELNVTLRPDNASPITVFLPNGAPAAGADVGLVSKGADLLLKPGGFARQNSSGGAALLTTDAQGQFKMPADESILKVVVATLAGYVEAPPAALAANPTLTLQPWGRLEGTFLSGSQPATGRELFLHFLDVEITTVIFSFETFVAKTDDQGKFSFPMVPPTKLKLVQLVPVGNNTRTHEPIQDVEIRPGETTTVTIGGSGYTVTACVVWPQGASRAPKSRLMASVNSAPPPALAQAMQDPQAIAALKDSPELKAYASSARHFTMAVSPDDTLRAENVPAGDYMVWIMTMPDAVPVSGAQPPQVCSGSALFTVPAEPATGTIDLGAVTLTNRSVGAQAQ